MLNRSAIAGILGGAVVKIIPGQSGVVQNVNKEHSISKCSEDNDCVLKFDSIYRDSTYIRRCE